VVNNERGKFFPSRYFPLHKKIVRVKKTGTINNNQIIQNLE